MWAGSSRIHKALRAGAGRSAVDFKLARRVVTSVTSDSVEYRILRIAFLGRAYHLARNRDQSAGARISECSRDLHGSSSWAPKSRTISEPWSAAGRSPAGADWRLAVCVIVHSMTEESNGPGMDYFYSPHYQIHNSARLNHLASLGLPLAGRRVIEIGCGPGDHTGFFLQRGCSICAVDARQECIQAVQTRYPGVVTAAVDMNKPDALRGLGTFEIVYCYGLLYHLEDPNTGIANLASACSDLLLLESCVSAAGFEHVYHAEELAEDFTQSIRGLGCRPTRQWLFKSLQRHFPFVYQTRTQPNHPEFPLDWSTASDERGLIRIVLVASRQPLDNDLLSPSLLEQQEQFEEGWASK
jgi:SAM-dependent methyltransferase